MISYSPLLERGIFFDISIISSLNLYTQRLAKSQTKFSGFSMISEARPHEFCLKIPYLLGSDTACTNAPYHENEIILSKSF